MTHIRALLQGLQLCLQLQRIDDEAAAAARGRGCPCGGRLHSARYPRKPRGGPIGLHDGFQWRWSFCCASEGCRRRTTPPSVRFLGRKVYLGTVVVLLSAAARCLSVPRVARLRELVGASRRTLRRWLRWWEVEFATSRFWQAMRGRFAPPPAVDDLPKSLLDRFADGNKNEEQQVMEILRFLSPITTGSAGSDF